MQLQASVHPEDAFISEFTARVAARGASRAERRLARELAAELLDLDPDLAYPWGAIDREVLEREPALLAPRGVVEPAVVARLQRELRQWLMRTGRIEREGEARLMCRNVGGAATCDRAIAA